MKVSMFPSMTPDVAERLRDKLEPVLSLSKSEVLDGLDGLMEKSMETGLNGRLPSGEDISIATTKFESQSAISPTMLGAVKQFRQGSQSN